MSETVAPEALGSGEELCPVDVFLQELDELACRWGGNDYRRGYIDGVYMMRGVRLRGEDSMTKVRFDADRIREVPHAEDYYTAYTLNITVSRDIDELPPHVYSEALGVYEPAELACEDLLKEEKHRFVFTIRDDLKSLEQEIEISYLVDGAEVYSLSTADQEYPGEAAADEEDEDENEAGGVAIAPQPMSGEDYEKLRTEPDMPDEARLLNDAWALLATAKKRAEGDELEFDAGMLYTMAKIERRLQKEESKLWRLFSLARCELQDMQIQHCRQVLKKLKAGTTL